MSDYFNIIRGQIGVKDYPALQNPEVYANTIIKERPNISLPFALNALRGKKTSVTNPRQGFIIKRFPTPYGDITAGQIFSDSACTVPLTGTLAADATAYVKFTGTEQMDLLDYFVAGMTVLLRSKTDPLCDAKAIIQAVTISTTGSLTLKIIKAMDSGKACENFNYIQLIGSAYSEGADRPDATKAFATDTYNYTQIFRKALRYTRTAMQTNLRTPEDIKEARVEAFEDLLQQLDWSFLYGARSTGIDSVTHDTVRTTMGLIDAIREYNDANIFNYVTDTDTDYAGKTWDEGGLDWLTQTLDQIAMYGNGKKILLGGGPAYAKIVKAAKTSSIIQIAPGDDFTWGNRVQKIITRNGEFSFIQNFHIQKNPVENNTLYVFEPEQLSAFYMQQPILKLDETWKKGGGTGADAINEEYLTEVGLELGSVQGCGIIYGVGKDNKVS